MKMMGEYLVEMISWMESVKRRELCIVECGTIRNLSFEGHEDGFSTYHIAKWIRDTPGWRHQFYSFEASPGCIQGCESFLEALKMDEFVEFGLGDAAVMLQHFNKPIDFCYLDAGADVVENLKQFRHAQKWMDVPGFVVIDDVYDRRNADRGLVTVPFARLEGYTVARVANRMAAIAFGEQSRDFFRQWPECVIV
jgi:Methyltransferase domain